MSCHPKMECSLPSPGRKQRMNVETAEKGRHFPVVFARRRQQCVVWSSGWTVCAYVKPGGAAAPAPRASSGTWCDQNDRPLVRICIVTHECRNPGHKALTPGVVSLTVLKIVSAHVVQTCCTPSQTCCTLSLKKLLGWKKLFWKTWVEHRRLI